MACIKTSKIILPKIFQLEISPGWILDIDTSSIPSKYTLTHGKKSMTFDNQIAKDLCTRNYSVRLAMGRRQMVVPPEVLQAFYEHEIFLKWYDQSLETVDQSETSHVTFSQSETSRPKSRDLPLQ